MLKSMSNPGPSSPQVERGDNVLVERPERGAALSRVGRGERPLPLSLPGRSKG
jgi:hypothetical protein